MEALVNLRRARHFDIDSISSLFIETQPDRIWARGGPRICRFLVRQYCLGSLEFTVVATRNRSEVIGACFGTRSRQDLMRRLLQANLAGLACTVAAEAVLRPHLLSALIARAVRETFFRAGVARSAGPIQGNTLLPRKDAKVWDATLIIVATAFRNHGVATGLLDKYVQEIPRGEYDFCRGHTLPENAAMMRALKKAGFEPVVGSGDMVPYLIELSKGR